MSSSRTATAGATRTCPHCRAMILDSAAVCPQCQKYLRFDAGGAEESDPGVAVLQIEGTLQRPPHGESLEYTMLLSIRDERGEEVVRKVIGVGALTADQARTFSLSVRVSDPTAEGPQ